MRLRASLRSTSEIEITLGLKFLAAAKRAAQLRAFCEQGQAKGLSQPSEAQPQLAQPHLKPTTASSRLPLVHRARLQRVLRVPKATFRLEAMNGWKREKAALG